MGKSLSFLIDKPVSGQLPILNYHEHCWLTVDTVRKDENIFYQTPHTGNTNGTSDHLWTITIKRRQLINSSIDNLNYTKNSRNGLLTIHTRLVCVSRLSLLTILIRLVQAWGEIHEYLYLVVFKFKYHG